MASLAARGHKRNLQYISYMVKTLYVPVFFFITLFLISIPLLGSFSSFITRLLGFKSLFFNIFNLSIEEEINHDIPFLVYHKIRLQKLFYLLFANCPLKIRTSLASIQKIMEIDSVLLLLQGIAQSTYSRGESVSQRAMQGMLAYDASTTACLSLLGSATIKSLGSLNLEKLDDYTILIYCLVFWLVKVPGVHLEEEVAVAPVYLAYLMTALWP